MSGIQQHGGAHVANGKNLLQKSGQFPPQKLEQKATTPFLLPPATGAPLAGFEVIQVKRLDSSCFSEAECTKTKGSL